MRPPEQDAGVRSNAPRNIASERKDGSSPRPTSFRTHPTETGAGPETDRRESILVAQATRGPSTVPAQNTAFFSFSPWNVERVENLIGRQRKLAGASEGRIRRQNFSSWFSTETAPNGPGF
ncbi:metalloprotease [Anopheles sinensis]|uniref:Metalloprotease n=1 Tax=Anopheles sinensis TaxID=74873 RepID=A0A084WTQ2_ANOSI|nr:metalloprotease [Anopheles sinensis]